MDPFALRQYFCFLANILVRFNGLSVGIVALNETLLRRTLLVMYF